MTLSVLMFCPQFAPITGGAERQAAKLSRELVRQGVHTAILTPSLIPESPAFEEDEGVAIHRFPLFDLNRQFPSFPGTGPANLASLAYQTRRSSLAAMAPFGVIHAHGVSALTAFALATARKLNKPFLCKLASSGNGFDLTKLQEIGWGGNSLANYMRNQVTAWIATTDAVADALAKAGIRPDRTVHIPNGVDLPVTEPPRTHPAAQRFLYVGRISRACDRDFDGMLEAFFSIAEVHTAAEFALVGEGDLLEDLKAKTSATPYAPRIHMPGFAKDPGSWFAWADFFVLPSRREGMSNALIEAMAAGLVPLANDIPANREVLAGGTAGSLIPVGNVAALVTSMKRLLENSGEFKRLRENALARAQNFAIGPIAQEYISLYRKLTADASLSARMRSSLRQP